MPDTAVGTRTDKLPAVTAVAPGATATDPQTGALPAAPAIGTGTLKLPAVAVSAGATADGAPAAAPPEARAAEPDLSFEVEEVAPDSKPSGVGEKYVPKDEGAPPVVLNEDVQAAERRAQAALEAQHRARRAPTIARLKVVELPETLASPEPFVPPKKGNGRFIALAVGVVVLVAGAALSLGGRGKSGSDKVEPEHSAVATVAPDTAAPPPPPLPSAAAAPTQPSQAPEAPASTAAPAEPPTPPPAAEEKPHEPPPKHASKAAGAAQKPAPAPKAPPAQKTAPAALKPASKPAGAAPKPGGKAVIVRDSPF